MLNFCAKIRIFLHISKKKCTFAKIFKEISKNRPGTQASSPAKKRSAPQSVGAHPDIMHILLSIFCRKSHILLCKNQRKLHILLCNSDDFIPLGCLASYIECTLFQRTCGVSVIKTSSLIKGVPYFRRLV